MRFEWETERFSPMDYGNVEFVLWMLGVSSSLWWHIGKTRLRVSKWMDSYYAEGAPTPSVLYVARHFCCLTVPQLDVRRLHSKIPVISGCSRIMCIFFGKSHIDEAVDVYDQPGVPVRSMKISDIITEKGLTTQSGQSEASITTPSPPSKLRVATPSCIYERRRIIEHNIQAVQQGGIKLSDWKEDTQAVKECGVWRSDDVSTSFKMKNDQAGVSNRPVFRQFVTPHPVLHNRLQAPWRSL